FWNLHALVGGRIESLLDHSLLEVMTVKRRVEDPLGFEWSRQNVKALNATVGYVDTVVGNNNLIVHQLLETQSTPYAVLVTLFRRANGVIIASLRSRNGEALRLAEKLQGGGHANAAAAPMPKSVRTVPEAVNYLRQALNPSPKRDTPLNNLESLFAAIELKDR
ncbi:MAG TPA: DHH family phosphoesterase, partial [Candidatus Binatia bacterium]|nr:DHH family phosphoesterase [Candidatus Binatia bacterium]